MTGMSKKYKPNFLIAGAPRCGSTSIYRALQQVNGVYMPENKEPHYFCANSVGRGPRGEGADTVTSEEEYFELFNSSESKEAIVRGECSIGYLNFSSSSIAKIKECLGDEVKIIITLREPVARAYSSYLLHRKHLSENYSFEKATSTSVMNSRKAAGYWFGFRYLELSEYAANLNKFMNEFKNVHVLILEEFALNPKVEFERLLEFLLLSDVDVDSLDLASPKNASVVDRFVVVARILNKLHKHAGPLGGCVESLKTHLQYRPLIDSKCEQELRRYFKPDVAGVEALLGRKISTWGY